MKNYDQATIASVFQNNSNMKHIIRDALAKFEDDYDEDMSFSEAMEQFLYTFESIASEHAAANVLGVDIVHYYVRENSQMNASDVQYQIDYVQFRDFDKCVNALLWKISKGDYDAAVEQYRQLFAKCILVKPRTTKRSLNQYLVNVNNETGAVDDSVNLKAVLEKISMCKYIKNLDQ